MYIGLGQEETVVEKPKEDRNKEFLVGIAALMDPLAQATSATFEIKMRADVNEARIKAGLDPLPQPGTALTAEPVEERGISTSSLLLGLMLVGGVLYLISSKK